MYRPQRTSGLGSIGYSRAPVPWLVDQSGVAVTPTDQGRFLAVLTPLLHGPANFTPLSVEIKPVLVGVTPKGERRPALICTSVRGIFLPGSFSVESFGPKAARSLCFQHKRRMDEEPALLLAGKYVAMVVTSEDVLSKMLSPSPPSRFGRRGEGHWVRMCWDKWPLHSPVLKLVSKTGVKREPKPRNNRV